MNLLEKKSVRLLSIGFTAIFFVNSLFMALITGGRWDLNQQIAFGERLAHGILGYSNGITDLFFPSSPYFPGVGYLSYFYRLVGIDDIYINNQLMLFTAVVVGLLYFILLKKLTLKLYPGISNAVVTIILIVLYATHFRMGYISYMLEFKPDTIVLAIATVCCFLLECDKKPSMIHLIGVGVLLFLATFFKQSFFIVFAFVFLLIFFNRFFSLKEKIVVMLSYGIIGVFALALIFMIPNVYYVTVDVMGQHPMLDIKTIIGYFTVGIKFNVIFVVAFLFFLVKRFRFSISTLESNYFLFALLWFVFSAISAAKLGGNSGNVESGLIVFMPFVIYAIDSVFKRFYSKKVFLAFTYSILIIGTLAYCYRTVRFFDVLVAKIKNDAESIAFLSYNFKDKKVFIDGTTYIVAEMSEMKVVTELETAGHFGNVAGYDFYRLKDAIKLKKYDLFFLSQEVDERFFFFRDKNILKEIHENYTVYDNVSMPECLKGKLLVPKKDK